MIEGRRSFWNWLWPPPPIARRLWLMIALVTGYTASVCGVRAVWSLEVPTWTNELPVINAVVIGVLVGFRTKAAYDRWWEGRILWGSLTNHSRNLCLKVVALADPPTDDRQELLRLVVGFPVALMYHLRGRVGLKEIHGFAADPADPAHVPAEIARRVFVLVAAWRAGGRIDGHAQQLLDPHAAALMDVCGACERIRNTPLPSSYLSLLRHGLLLGMLLVPWHLATTLGFWAIPMMGLVVYFLVGIELIAEEVEQPFGFDGDDLPLERYCETIRASTTEILNV